MKPEIFITVPEKFIALPDTIPVITDDEASPKRYTIPETPKGYRAKIDQKRNYHAIVRKTPFAHADRSVDRTVDRHDHHKPSIRQLQQTICRRMHENTLRHQTQTSLMTCTSLLASAKSAADELIEILRTIHNFMKIHSDDVYNDYNLDYLTLRYTIMITAMYKYFTIVQNLVKLREHVPVMENIYITNAFTLFLQIKCEYVTYKEKIDAIARHESSQWEISLISANCYRVFTYENINVFLYNYKHTNTQLRALFMPSQ
jgi:hypothetical protein